MFVYIYIYIYILTKWKKLQNHCFFKVVDHNSAQMACPDLARGLVMITSHEEPDFDSRDIQNH